MKSLIATLLIATLPALAFAQTAAPGKPAAAKPAATKPAAKAPAPGRNPKLAPSAQKAVEESTEIDDDPNITFTEADLEMAQKVYVGEIPCELGASVRITPMRRNGMFMVITRGHRFRMHPVESRTGAIRLEDPVRGAMWLQLGNKSMLMSQKMGQRLADECQSPQQLTYAEKLKANPLPSILEPLPPVAPRQAP
ncbi:MAG: hypothetical protein Q8S20_03850 [Sulfuritalea sp.]|nr:hypothetical protein [Sulfuritalea sp.]